MLTAGLEGSASHSPRRRRRAFAPASTAALAAVTLALPAAAVPAPTYGTNLGRLSSYDGWQLVWEDDFTSPPNALNASNWSPRVNQTHCDPCELQLYLPDALTVDNSTLIITTSREKAIGPGGELFNFTSGWVDTRGKQAWKYGRFEVRAILPGPGAAGTWPAHWLLPDDNECWPVGGEIDIMENTRMPLVGDVIFGSYRWGTSCSNNKQVLPGAAYPPLGAPAVNWTDYHVFGVEWNATALSFYVDDTLYETKTSTQVNLPTAPMYFILNTAVAWYWPPGPDATYPATHVIDWVRVWQQPNTTTNA